MLKPDDFIGCGQVAKAHGIKGDLKIGFVSNFIPDYQQGDWLFLEFQKKPVPFFIEYIEYPGDGLPVVKLSDIGTREKAQELVNRQVLFPKNSIPEGRREALLVYQLDQFMLYNGENQYKGIIRDIIEETYQFLLEVEMPNRKEPFLVPFHPSLIASINREANYVIMSIPEGLEDL